MAGKVVHVEISATDTSRAQGFYSGVFGWEIGPPHVTGDGLPDVPDRRGLGRRDHGDGRAGELHASTSTPTTSTPRWRR